jgi:hypothetical protein
MIDAGVYSSEEEAVGHATVTVPVENVGAGLALIEGTSLHGLFPGIDLVHSSTQSAVRPGQRITLSFSGEIDQADASYLGDDRDRTAHEFSVEVWYTDLSGGQRTRSHILIEGTTHHLRATRVLAYEGDSQQAFADFKREVLTVSLDARRPNQQGW